ncbi:hypothetical protein [Ralstonia pseudosolanacearum]|uniref:hypothetical protein n=1 Tax=Ralstonia pseudosolanacearum TaxID=1310165 RepID=UPI003CF3423C
MRTLGRVAGVAYGPNKDDERWSTAARRAVTAGQRRAASASVRAAGPHLEFGQAQDNRLGQPCCVEGKQQVLANEREKYCDAAKIP